MLSSYGAGYPLGTPYWETPEGGYASVNCANTFDSDGILLIKARELREPLEEPRSLQKSTELLCTRPSLISIYMIIHKYNKYSI